MPKDWSDSIVLAELADEPELSEELTSVYQRIADGPAERVPSVVLNFAAVTYLNSSNIAQVLRLRRRLIECDRKLILCAIADPVWSTMLLTGLDKVFAFMPDTATALASLQIGDHRG